MRKTGEGKRAAQRRELQKNTRRILVGGGVVNRKKRMRLRVERIPPCTKGLPPPTTTSIDLILPNEPAAKWRQHGLFGMDYSYSINKARGRVETQIFEINAESAI
jgi:hypothetical protein